MIRALGAKSGGYFIDSGASDGLCGSNTFLLENAYGWRGICIEPNDRLFASLRDNRRATCVNCCLNDRGGEVDFLEDAGVYGGIIDDYDPPLLEFVTTRFRDHLDFAPDGSVRCVRKSAKSIGEVLREHDAPRVIDYWSLDTEGSELSVLRGFPFGEYTVRAMTVEHNHAPDRERIHAFLCRHGYRRVGNLGIDDCYLLAGSDSVPARAWRSAAWARTRGAPA